MTPRFIRPAAFLGGSLVVPGDKSISHRALIFGALADGTSTLDHVLTAEDCLSTASALRALGVRLVIRGDRVTVHGSHRLALSPPRRSLEMGNSGTTARLLLGVLAGQPFRTTLVGDASLSRRPMRRVTDPLRAMGAVVRGRGNANYLPLEIEGGELEGIRYRNTLGSAQVKSAILLAGLYAEGETVVQDVSPSRDHTERFLKLCRAPFVKRGNALCVKKAARLVPFRFHVPGDFSSAAFFLTAALFVPSELTLKGVSLNPTRTGYLDLLRAMGARIRVRVTRRDPEPVGDLMVQPSTLKPVKLKQRDIPRLIDELPLLALAAARIEGETVLEGLGELRVKESDRLHLLAVNLKRLGVRVSEKRDGLRIEGRGAPFRSASVRTEGDHRLAMTFSVAGLLSENGVRVDHPECVKISYPAFFSDLETLSGSRS